MNWKRIVTKAVAEGTALWHGGRIRPGFRVLLYHAVGTRLQYDPYGISIGSRLFKQHMQVLAEHEKLDVVNFDLKALKKSSAPPPPSLEVAVTFDDGYKDNLTVVAPILVKLGIPFTVFVTSAFIQSGSAEYLAPDELRELAALPGVSIGAHGATHRPLAACDDAMLWQELQSSRCYLEDILQQPVTALAYPNGSTNRRVREAAQRAGYNIGGSSRFDINDETRDPLLLCRCELLANDSVRVFQQKLHGAWDWYRWRSKDPALS